ncbi:MAG: hypothetical protein WC529_07485 [Candidatus Margulisiibacteriota bacterium]
MNKLKQKGVWLLLGWLAVAALSPAWGALYAGNVFLSATVLNGTQIVGVFTAKPHQNTLAADGIATAVVADNQTYAGTTYAKMISIEKCPAETAYILLKGGGIYAVTSVKLKDSSAPNIVLPKPDFYTTGDPQPPVIGEIKKGFETAKVLSLTYDPAYDYSGTGIEIIGSGSGVLKQGKVAEYSMGEMVNGVTLESSKTYTFKIWGIVSGVTENQAKSNAKDFTMNSGGAQNASTETYKLSAAGFGLNTLAISFDRAKGEVKGIGGMRVATQGTVLTVERVIKEINRQAGGKLIVKSVGFYDNARKVQVGLSRVDAVLTDSIAVNDTAQNILDRDVTGQPLQIAVTDDLWFELTGYK